MIKLLKESYEHEHGFDINQDRLCDATMELYELAEVDPSIDIDDSEDDLSLESYLDIRYGLIESIDYELGDEFDIMMINPKDPRWDKVISDIGYSY